jgi:hypothetical protein
MPHPTTPDLFADPALGFAVCRQLDHGTEQDLFAVATRTVESLRQEIETVAKQARAEYDRLDRECCRAQEATRTPCDASEQTFDAFEQALSARANQYYAHRQAENCRIWSNVNDNPAVLEWLLEMAKNDDSPRLDAMTDELTRAGIELSRI